MGCDGGTIPKRDELVRTKKKGEQKDKDAENHCKWRLCASSQEQLRSPIVACELGRLFNKESVLEILLDKAKAPECGKHLRNLKDIKELVLTPNPSFQSSATKGDGAYDDRPAEFICPVLGIEMNGKFKFCFIWTCGCVMSERSLKEIKTTTCHKCQQPFKEEDVIILNPNEEELSVLVTNMESRRLAAKANGKGKSLKRQAVEGDASKAGGSKDVKKSKKTEANGTASAAGSSSNNIAQKLLKLEDPEMAKIRSSYSIAKDPNASEAYKSLFTTHKKALNQTRGHWVTYNPFFN